MVNKKTNKPAQWVSVPQAAEIMGVSRITVYNKVKAGLIKSTRVGRNFLIPVTELSLHTKQLDEASKKQIKEAVAKVISQYGDVIKRLGKE